MAEATIIEDSVVRPEDLDIRQMDTSLVGEVPLSDEQERDLKVYLDQEIYLALGERTSFIDNLVRWQEVYDAPMATEPKDFPLADSANLTVPIIKEMVNTLTAQFTQTVLTPRPRWILQAMSEEWGPFVGIIEDFMDLAAERDLKFDKRIETWILEAAKLGTSVIQVGYTQQAKNFYVYSRDGMEVRKVRRVTHDGPILYNIPLEDYIQPFTSVDPQEARWCGKRFRVTGKWLMDRAEDGGYHNVSQVVIGQTGANYGTDYKTGDVQEKQEMLEATTPNRRDTYEIYEIWLSWDVDGDGLEEEIVAWYHPPTQTLLRVQYHMFWHSERPFIVLRYFPKEYRFYGQGLCDQLEALQEEISEIHNQRLDNASIANVRPLLVRRGSKSLKPGDPLFTGQPIPVDNPDDVVPLVIGEIYPSTIMNEDMTRSYAERLSGANEASSRGAMPVTRTTATAQLALLQEQAKRFDQTIRNARDGIAKIGWYAFSTYFQFGADEKKIVQWLGERGRIISGIFNLKRSASELGLGFTASAPTSQQNKELQKQNALAVFNLTIQMYTQLLQLAVQTGTPAEALAPVAAKLVQSAERFMFQILDRFDVSNPDDIIAGLKILEKILPKPEDLGGLETFARAEEAADRAESLARLEALLTEAGGAETGGVDLSRPREIPRGALLSTGLLRGGGESRMDGGEPSNRS